MHRILAITLTVAALVLPTPCAAQTDVNAVLATVEAHLRLTLDAEQQANHAETTLDDPEIEVAQQWGSPSSIGTRQNLNVSQRFDAATLTGSKRRLAGARDEEARQRYALERSRIMLDAREAIADVKFIKGLKYEDIPWWSTVILKPLRATITRLPLYYYTPNLDSITKSTDYSVRVLHILHGLGTTFDNYPRDADRRSMHLWSHNIKWAILCGIAGRINVLASRPEAKSVTAKLAELDSGHFFDDALTKRELCAQKVFLSFLKNPSACATL